MTRQFPCPAMIDAGWNSTQHHCVGIKDFFNISPNLEGKIPNMGVSSVDYMGQPLVNGIFQSEVTTNEISQIWGSLKNGAAGREENECMSSEACITIYSWTSYVFV